MWLSWTGSIPDAQALARTAASKAAGFEQRGSNDEADRPAKRARYGLDTTELPVPETSAVRTQRSFHLLCFLDPFAQALREVYRVLGMVHIPSMVSWFSSKGGLLARRLSHAGRGAEHVVHVPSCMWPYVEAAVYDISPCPHLGVGVIFVSVIYQKCPFTRLLSN